MSKGACLAALLVLGGCAHIAPPRPAFECVSEVGTERRRVTTQRLLDRDGRQLRLHSHWFEHGTLASDVSIGSGWYAQAGEPIVESAPVSLIYSGVSDKAMKRIAGVELRWGSPSNRATDPRLVNRKRANLSVFPPLTLMRQLIASGQPLYFVLIDRQEQTLRSERIEPAIFERGVADLRATLADSAAKARNPAQLCRPYEEIILL